MQGTKTRTIAVPGSLRIAVPRPVKAKDNRSNTSSLVDSTFSTRSSITRPGAPTPTRARQGNIRSSDPRVNGPAAVTITAIPAPHRASGKWVRMSQAVRRLSSMSLALPPALSATIERTSEDSRGDQASDTASTRRGGREWDRGDGGEAVTPVVQPTPTRYLTNIGLTNFSRPLRLGPDGQSPAASGQGDSKSPDPHAFSYSQPDSRSSGNPTLSVHCNDSIASSVQPPHIDAHREAINERTQLRLVPRLNRRAPPPLTLSRDVSIARLWMDDIVVPRPTSSAYSKPGTGYHTSQLRQRRSASIRVADTEIEPLPLSRRRSSTLTASALSHRSVISCASGESILSPASSVSSFGGSYVSRAQPLGLWDGFENDISVERTYECKCPSHSHAWSKRVGQERFQHKPRDECGSFWVQCMRRGQRRGCSWERGGVDGWQGGIRLDIAPKIF